MNILEWSHENYEYLFNVRVDAHKRFVCRLNTQMGFVSIEMFDVGYEPERVFELYATSENEVEEYLPDLYFELDLQAEGVNKVIEHLVWQHSNLIQFLENIYETVEYQ